MMYGGIRVTTKTAIQVRVTPAQEREFKRLAAKSDMNLSEWARAVLLAGSVMIRQPAIAAQVTVSSRPVVRVTDGTGATVEDSPPVRRSKGSRRRVQGA